jgi:ATP-binding cassette subfamily B protein/subfamily B ATP-binding cassette protein MsbA
MDPRMSNFGRVLRLTLRYRFTLICSVICALGVAVLWGGNIGAIFPFLQIANQGQSLQQWVESEIQKSGRTVVQLQSSLDQLQRQLAHDQQAPPGLKTQIIAIQSRVEAEEKACARYRRLQPYVNRFLPRDPFVTLALIVLGLLVGTVLKDLFLIANSILVARLAELTTFDLRKLFYRRTLRMDMATFSNDGTSELMSRFTNDMNNVSSGLVALFGKLVREPLKAVACLVGAGCICWRLLLLSLVIAPPAVLSIRWLAKMLKRSNRKAMEEMAQIYNTLDETFRGIKIVKAFTMERQERRRFHHISKKYYRKAMKIARYDSLSHPITEVMGILTICLATLAGAWLVLQGETHLFGFKMSDRPLSLTSLMVFYAFLAGVADPARKLSEVLTRIQQASAASDRIYALLDREPHVSEPERPQPLGRHRLDLVFDNVGFAYQTGNPIISNINLHIQFGERIAIVGPNGCGKTTLASLIPRFADPTEGLIRIDGIPLAEVSLRELRGQIGLVSQETVLFDDTVYNNIRYGAQNASRQQVIEAARQAHAHQFIEEQLPDGYDTVVGQHGGRLSGGQRQRIALARAILRDPAIIILDEATSQVDLESEQLIQNVLEQFIQNRTAVIITHRLAVLTLADRIVVMDGGRILDVGTHEELRSRCGLYSRLYQIQSERPGTPLRLDRSPLAIPGGGPHGRRPERAVVDAPLADAIRSVERG